MSDLWFTPAYIVEPFRELSGGRIDLDPASCAEANEVIRAANFYTEADNGLLLPWSRHILINPPFSKIDQFVAKGMSELETGDVESQLWVTNANTEVAWFKKLSARANAICFPSKRIQFWLPGGKIKGCNRRSQALFYFGSDVQGFTEKYRHIGLVMPMVGPECRPWLHPTMRARLYKLVCRCCSVAEGEQLLMSVASQTADGLHMNRYELSTHEYLIAGPLRGRGDNSNSPAPEVTQDRSAHERK